MTTPQGEQIDRLPPWIKRVTQNLAYSPIYDAIFWNPPKKYVFKNKPPPRPLSVRVYEAHGILPPCLAFLTFQSEFRPQSTASVLILNSRQMSCPELRSLDTTSFSSWQSWNTPIMHPLDTRSPVSLLPRADMVVASPVNTPDFTRNP